MDGLWEVAVSSLQDTCNANEQRSFDLRFNAAIEEMSPKELAAYRESVEEHRENAKKGRRLINTALENVVALIEARQEAPEPRSRKKEEAKPKKSGRR
ncbi:unnamed protein product [Kuraishia capsulata CBS 1993]|uniref:Uncharacterized protein n=1 Tax=Kuraishia capsulata CBS 1993 TaxID=1382522 RepID=W6MWL7_9ASCO|nr:uncharacterized protein KUCA_T00003609001 [Kuraishia capsulata CBS 1993]CDK27630.1 unnamed protein product [Kuraishia capsulata CBS 1993]